MLALFVAPEKDKTMRTVLMVIVILPPGRDDRA